MAENSLVDRKFKLKLCFSQKLLDCCLKSNHKTLNIPKVDYFDQLKYDNYFRELTSKQKKNGKTKRRVCLNFPIFFACLLFLLCHKDRKRKRKEECEYWRFFCNTLVLICSRTLWNLARKKRIYSCLYNPFINLNVPCLCSRENLIRRVQY